MLYSQLLWIETESLSAQRKSAVTANAGLVPRLF